MTPRPWSRDDIAALQWPAAPPHRSAGDLVHASDAGTSIEERRSSRRFAGETPDHLVGDRAGRVRRLLLRIAPRVPASRPSRNDIGVVADQRDSHVGARPQCPATMAGYPAGD